MPAFKKDYKNKIYYALHISYDALCSRTLSVLTSNQGWPHSLTWVPPSHSYYFASRNLLDFPLKLAALREAFSVSTYNHYFRTDSSMCSTLTSSLVHSLISTDVLLKASVDIRTVQHGVLFHLSPHRLSWATKASRESSPRLGGSCSVAWSMPVIR